MMGEYLSKRSLIKHTLSWRDKLLLYYKKIYFKIYNNPSEFLTHCNPLCTNNYPKDIKRHF